MVCCVVAVLLAPGMFQVVLRMELAPWLFLSGLADMLYTMGTQWCIRVRPGGLSRQHCAHAARSIRFVTLLACTDL